MFEAPSLAELNLIATVPALSVGLGACLLLLVDLWIPRDRKDVTAWLAIGNFVFALVVNMLVYNNGGEAFLGAFVADRFTGFMNIVILLTAILSVVLSMDYLKRTNSERGEFYPLMMLTVTGMMFMVSANDLTIVFVALELLSIPLYILSAFRAHDTQNEEMRLRSEESGMKYFILGAFASAFFVFGAAFVYGATGSTSLPVIFESIAGTIAGEASSSPIILLLGVGLVIVGLGFKVAVVPFHMWTPDVYEGAPTPVTAFMSVGAKIGGFGSLLRIMLVGLPGFVILDGQTIAAWQLTVALVAAVTLIFGNLVAIAQTNIKRLLAYSSIAHAGYILMAVAAGATAGVADMAAQSALIYLMTYMFTNLGAFAIAMAIERDDGSGTSLDDFIGLGKSQPLLAFIMAVFMLSLTGIPPTAGFVGKWFVFQSTMASGLSWLAVIGVLTSVISAYYYVRVIVNMYLREGDGDPAAALTPRLSWVIYLTFAGTLLVGILPALVTNLSDGIVLLSQVLMP